MVITDWEMPGMDGTALSRAIRGHGGGLYAYVIVLTGAADEEAARSTMEAGADDLLLKPPDLAQLERKLIAAGRVTALHRRLHDDARHDTLTALGNRLRLAEDLEALCGRVERYGHSYCVALFDIDDFKGYNDGAGHLGGDGALRAVAGALQQQIRTGDAVYRYGGEEFLVLLPEQSIETAGLAAERLRNAVEALGLPHPAGGVVTVSAGVAQLHDGASRPDQVFELADQALYRAKENGRNRVEVHSGSAATDEASIRLLIADDDATIRLTLSALLQREDGIRAGRRGGGRRGGDRDGRAPAPERRGARLRHARRRRRARRERDPRGQPDHADRRAERRRQPVRAVRHVPCRRDRLRGQGRAGRGDRARDPQRRALVITARP